MHKLIGLALILFFCVLAYGQPAGPKIVAPDETLHDNPVSVSVTGLVPDSVCTLRFEFVTKAGTIWRSEAQFKASASGIVDLNKDASLSGSYQGVDPLGLFWSMENTKERQTDPSVFESDDQSVISMSVRDGEKAAAQHTLIIRKRQIGVATTEIRGPVTGTFLLPPNAKRLPAVIVLGGSEGGIPRDRAAMIASHGYATLALAYFGIEPLPAELEKVPVETVDRAVEWLRKQPGVDPARIAILGVSKGAELALLAASQNARIKAVVAIAPSSVVYQNLSRQNTGSSWTRGGKEASYVPFVKSEAFDKSRRLVDLYSSSLDAASPAAVIAVEKIGGPVLLIAGKSDQLWPSSRMADAIEDRLKKQNFPFALKKLEFEDVGHHCATLPMRPTADSVRLGGTAKAMAAAHVVAWNAIISFLGEKL